MSSFEEAIYRVYERCIENLRDEDDVTMNSRTCKLMETLSLGSGIMFLIALISLHWGFVNQPGCLPGLLQTEMIRLNSTELLPFDAILQINVDKYFVGDATTRNALRDGDDVVADTESGRRNLRQLFGISSTSSLHHLATHPRVPKYTQANLKEMKTTHAQRSSGANRRGNNRRAAGLSVFKPMFGLMEKNADSLTYHGVAQRPASRGILSSLFASVTHAAHNSSSSSNTTTEANSTMSIGNNTAPANTTSIFNPLYYEQHDFEFAFDVGILELSGYLRQIHSFQLINVTMQGQQCLGNPFLQSLIPLGGIDTVILNSIFATVNKAGMLINSQGEYNIWHERDVHQYSNPAEWLGFKIDMVIKSLFLFFLLTTITALLVRMLISSGVVLLFPMFWLIQYAGYNVINMRLISLSYPWIGIPMEMLRTQNQSSVPFLIGHMTRVIAYYTFYEATQFACSLWFYDQAQPSQRELWLFAIMMLWEYYSMIYVRASGSIILFPRASLALFLIYHFYLFSYPTGFHLLALLVMLFFLLFLMMYCVRKYEIAAFHRGLVTADQPRQFYNSIPWPVWSNDLAPEYSVFMPAARRSASMYAMPVPELPIGGGVDGGVVNNRADVGAVAGGGLGLAQQEGIEMSTQGLQSATVTSSTTTSTTASATPGAYQRLSDSSQH